ncbi:hypothetical protein SAMN05443549_103215 [Flavobacterium fluvii]|uniref:Uncharacterized protein n=1 Tax=Flavobacterium fluvii TaxID=468056 RepID=A0A1M5IRZ5_9FLAO|nr:hypothetical protein [Flavobacterium fluvii]SHG31087.1 hypothetical protein SAMN05443549_103215 [Flavobacterium fluvii]
MGKLTGIIKFKGTFDGLTFYKSPDGYLVKTKSGVSKSRIMNDPAFVRTRENLSEFSLNAKSGKALRQSIGPLLHRAKDSKLSSRMLQLMNSIKNHDGSSARGERLVRLGMDNPEGKLLLKGFDFNLHAPLSSVLHAFYSVDLSTGILSIPDFNPQEHLSVPAGATHVSFCSAYVDLDFETGDYDSRYSPPSILLLDNSISTLVLTPEAIPTGTGTRFHLLLIEFFQDVNGVQYSLRNGMFNVLNVVEVV